MVVFTCQHCGDSIAKPKVEKHYYTRCRNKKPNLTCVDCLKDFIGDMYNEHKQCVSEAQRYSAKGTIIKQPSGAKKQAQYIELIQDVLNTKNLTNIQRQMLEICSNHDNVPRKLPKFQNFMHNATMHGKKLWPTEVDVKAVFNILQEGWRKVQATANNNSNIKFGNSNDSTSIIDPQDISNNLNDKNASIEDGSEVNCSKNNDIEKSQTTNTEKIDTENIMSEETKENNLHILSKKELKKKRKHEKYLMELNNAGKVEDDYLETSSYELKKKKKSTISEVNKEHDENDKNILPNLKNNKAKKSKKERTHHLDFEQTNNSNTFTASLENGERNSEDEINSIKKSKKCKKQNRIKQNPVTGTKMETPVEEESNKKKNKRQELDGNSCDTSEKKQKITSSQESNAENDERNSEGEFIGKSKKSKKQNRIKQNLVTETKLDSCVEEEKNEKKNKKRKLDDTSCNTTDKKQKMTSSQDEHCNQGGSASFDWADVIVRLLESKPEKELSIKKLGKKVVSEYQAIKPDHRTYEQLMAKFNKKVNKTQGVRVLKDKAKLIT